MADIPLGREISYHSDLDLILIYEADGQTKSDGRTDATTNHHYFTELMQRALSLIHI